MKLVLLYKATHQLVAVNNGLYLIPITAPTHQDHSHTYQRIATKSNYHKYSIVESPDLELFKAGLAGDSSPVTLM